MEEIFAAEAVRERLIIAGIRELESHGLNDFSLRRVAMACEVSCAAPYRHFKGKDELILEIVRYINGRWFLLRDQINDAFRDNAKKRLIETGVAHIRFWIANPNFRSVLLMDDPDPDSPRLRERKLISDDLERLIRSYCESNSIPSLQAGSIAYAYQALIYGTVLMLGNGELENDEHTIHMIREQMERILSDRTDTK